MSRYTDIDIFLQKIEERYCKDCEKRKGIKNGKRKFVYEIGEVPCRACDVDDMKFDIDNAPIADVVPAVHGHLERIPNTPTWKCSICGYEITGFIDRDGLTPMDCKVNYCSRCGAKMDEVTK